MSVLEVTYSPPSIYFKIPKEWNLDDIYVTWGELYYKNERVDVPRQELECDFKRPSEMTIREDLDADVFFDCEVHVTDDGKVI